MSGLSVAAAFALRATESLQHSGVVAYAPRVAGSMREDRREARRVAVPGSGVRATLVALALGGGMALAISLLHAIHAWRP
jgi:hypothetical protein